MQFMPICLECENFEKNDVCKVYGIPPFEIKERKRRCKYFTGGEYTLYNLDEYKKHK